jgi:tetratricopeptide (TPR) repeat protein
VISGVSHIGVAMVKLSKFFLFFIALGCSLNSYSVNEKRLEVLKLQRGDIITQQKEEGGWSTIKILEIDQWPDGSETAHCLLYQASRSKPSMADVESLGVYAFHAPIDAGSFHTDWEVVGNIKPASEDLQGFIEYLKLTDFQRYANYTNQDINAVVSEANSNYKKAIALGEEGKHSEAIEFYSKAIELFPLFYEAIDNRAFTYMDLGKFDIALSGFEDSLRVNPNGLTAFFSKGECLLKLGRYEDALGVFKEGIEKFPEKAQLFQEFYNKTKRFQENG